MSADLSGISVTVFGGTGYLGRHIVRRLMQNGCSVRVAVRHPQPDLFQDTGNVVQQTQADVTDKNAVADAVQGVDGVVNSVGLYVETGEASFDAIHIKGAREVALQAATAGAPLVHISGIGADTESASRYVAARAAGELAVREAAENAVILRPSVLFGPDDVFLDSLLKLVRFLPGIPLFGDGSKRLQPVHVEDVAEAVVCVFDEAGSPRTIYELGGPRIYTYRELLETIIEHLKRTRVLLPVPFTVWRLLAAGCAVLPNPPLTRDQIILMSHDNVVSPDHGTFQDLGINPQALEDTLGVS